jgi:hypothetical protein
MLENQIATNLISTKYSGNLDALADGIWMMNHDYLLGDQDRSFAAIVYLEQQQDRILSEGIVPLLKHRFVLFPDDLPCCFTKWYNLIKAYIERRIHNLPENLPDSVNNLLSNGT